VAPLVAPIADRRSPVVLLTAGYLVQAAAMAATAAAVIANVPLAAYAAAVVASTAVTTTRPAQSALVPSLAASPDQLTAANVVVGWRLRLMLALLTAEAVVVGALDLLVVILAISVLDRPQAWAGYLNFAFGAGAVLAATVSAALVGRRLGRPILAAALVLSSALAALAFGLGLAGTIALLIVAGASHALLEVATRTLLQRSVPPQLIGRIFGVLEGLMMAGYALGALLVPALVHLGATVIAHTAATVYELDREPFLTAVLGHAPTLRQADRIAEARLAAGAAPGRSDTSGTDAAEPT
jgi:hypothetical protein